VNVPTQPLAGSLDEFAGEGAITAAFSAGDTGLGHHWRLLSPSAALLARTARVHTGGKGAQVFWKFLSLTALDAGNDIHVELRGAEDAVLARASSINDKPAIVTVFHPTGAQVLRSRRDKDSLTVYGHDDQELAELACDGDGPWQVRNVAGNVVGDLIAGEPGLSTSQGLTQWVLAPQLALSSAAYAKGQHLGLRRVAQYTFAPTPSAPDLTPALALLPLACGLTY
jgi:hypothetical protein